MMGKPTGYTRNPNRARQLTNAVDQALFAAAEVIEDDVVLRFRERDQGYTSGDYAHTMGGVASTITKSEPHDHEGNRRILIGTNKTSKNGFSYPAAWEFGHINIAMGGSPGAEASTIGTRRTGTYQRVETFRPALDENRDRAIAAFWRSLERMKRTANL